METRTFKVASAPALVVPSNVEAEAAVLGSILIDRNALVMVLPILKSADFYIERHSWIFEAMGALYAQGKPIDALLILSELRARNRNEILEPLYLNELVKSATSARNAEHYARLVKEVARKRQQASLAGEIAGWAYDGDLCADAVDVKIQQAVLERAPQEGGAFVSASDAAGQSILRFRERAENPRALIGVPTGYVDLDAKLGGYQPGLIVIGAVPSMGKTSLALGSALKQARNHRKRVAFISLEMTVEQLTTRLVSYLSGINTDVIQTGLCDGRPLTPNVIAVIEQAHRVLADVPLWLIEMAGATSTEIRARASELKAREDIEIAWVDYAQKLRDTGENRNRELEAASDNFFECGKHLGIPLVLLSQLKRGIERRDSHIPEQSDFRDSGGIEASADVAIGLCNEDNYHRFDNKQVNPNSKYENKNELGVYILKDRVGKGAGKAAILRWLEQTGQVEDATPKRPDEYRRDHPEQY